MPWRSRHKALAPPPFAAGVEERLMTFEEIRQRLASKGILLSRVSVQLICRRAEQKLRARLRTLN